MKLPAILVALLASLVAFLAGSTLARAQEPATLAPERAAILERAEAFRTVRWTAEERHRAHGDVDGVRVDTPDVSVDASGWEVGEGNVGMPYCWGGFTSLEDFEAELAEDGRLAGHVPARGNAMGSLRTIGVDCSGLVSRCWNLPAKQSTRSIGALSYELDDYHDLLPGDVVNRFDAHVAIFTGWADEARTVMNVIEAARIKVDLGIYTLEQLEAQDYRPMRYKPLDPRWRAMPAPVTGSVEGVFVASGDAAPRDPLSELFRAGVTEDGAWARYHGSEDELADVTVTWMAVGFEDAEDGPRLVAQRQLDAESGSLATGDSFPLVASWTDVVAAFGSFSNPLQDLEAIEQRLEDGELRLGEHAFPARRLIAKVEGHMLSRSTLYPVTLDVECVFADQVPLLGLCSAKLRLDIDYGMRGEDRIIGRSERELRLAAFEH